MEPPVRAEPAAAGPPADHARGFQAREATLAQIRQIFTGALILTSNSKCL